MSAKRRTERLLRGTRFALTPGERRSLFALALLLLASLAGNLLLHVLHPDSESIIIRQVDENAEETVESSPETTNRAQNSEDSAHSQASVSYLTAGPPGDSSDQVAPAPDADGQASGTFSGQLIDLNRADTRQLQELPGIGPVLAGRIVEYRTLHGPYIRERDLLLIRGIGEKTLAKLQPYITVTR